MTKPPQTPSYSALARQGGDIASSILSPFAADLLALKTQIKPSKKAAPIDLELHINPLGIGAMGVMAMTALWLTQIRVKPSLEDTTLYYSRLYYVVTYMDTGMQVMHYQGKKYKSQYWQAHMLEIMGVPPNAQVTSTVTSEGWAENVLQIDIEFSAVVSKWTFTPVERTGFLEGYGGGLQKVLGTTEALAGAVTLGPSLWLAIMGNPLNPMKALKDYYDRLKEQAGK